MPEAGEAGAAGEGGAGGAGDAGGETGAGGAGGEADEGGEGSIIHDPNIPGLLRFLSQASVAVESPLAPSFLVFLFSEV